MDNKEIGYPPLKVGDRIRFLNRNRHTQFESTGIITKIHTHVCIEVDVTNIDEMRGQCIDYLPHKFITHNYGPIEKPRNFPPPLPIWLTN
jgi:hypothetical protein